MTHNDQPIKAVVEIGALTQSVAGLAELDHFLLMARERLRMDLVVLAADDADDGELRPISSAFWPSGAGPSAARLGQLERAFDEYLLDVRLGERLNSRARQEVRTEPEQDGSVGQFVEMPLSSGDAAPFGALYAFALDRRELLGPADADVLRPFANVIVDFILAGQDDWTRPVAARKILRRLATAGGPAVMFQPVVELASGRHIGREALARFPADSPSPSEWFQAADLAGQRTELELAAITAAVNHLHHGEVWTSINASEQTFYDPRFAEIVSTHRDARVVWEITEQHSIHDYERLREVVAWLHGLGMRIAIDDVGAGFSTLQHVLSLRPDIIKLDIALVRDIDRNSQQQAMVKSLNDFADNTGADLIAEGIETPGELDTLTSLGVRFGQGFHLGRPAPCTDSSDMPFTLPSLRSGL